jgi:hypothetical protein
MNRPYYIRSHSSSMAAVQVRCIDAMLSKGMPSTATSASISVDLKT